MALRWFVFRGTVPGFWRYLLVICINYLGIYGYGAINGGAYKIQMIPWIYGHERGWGTKRDSMVGHGAWLGSWAWSPLAWKERRGPLLAGLPMV